MSQIRPMGPREWGMLVVLSLLWGATFFYYAIALRELPVLTLVFLRVSISAVVLVVLLWLLGRVQLPDRAALVSYLGMGLLNNAIPFSLFALAQTRIPSGLAAILNGTTPLFTVLVLHFFSTDEKASPRKIAGTLIGFAGVAAMIGGAGSGAGADPFGQLAALGGALSYAFSGLWGRRFARQAIRPEMAAAGQMCASTLLLLPLVLVIDRPWMLAMPGTSTWLAVLALALLSTVLAYVLFFHILAVAGATNLLLVTFLIPVSAVLLGVGLLGETVEIKHVVGGLAIGAGLVLIDGRLLDWLTRRFRHAG